MSWLWKATQSAIFYYVSLSPCYEHSYNRKRRKEAKNTGKQRAELELSQPDAIHQPVPFQTNRFWSEEIQAGPGPPRGRKKHCVEIRDEGSSLGRKVTREELTGDESTSQQNTSLPKSSSHSKSKPETFHSRASPLVTKAPIPTAGSALDTFKDTLKSSLPRPDLWNSKRYDREDETLFGINDRLSRMWDRAMRHDQEASPDGERVAGHGHRKDEATSPDEYSWRYAKNPGLNDLHPPTVTQFPRSKREVAWIKQPPPSRAVMEGKVRPETESTERLPLCRLGVASVDQKDLKARKDRPLGPHADIQDANHTVLDATATHSKYEVDAAANYHDMEEDIYPEDIEYLTGLTLSPDSEDDDDDDDNNNDSDDAINCGNDSAQRDRRIMSVPQTASYRKEHPPSSLLPLQSLKSTQPLQRPPLAVLVDSNARSQKIHSYQIPIVSAKAAKDTTENNHVKLPAVGNAQLGLYRSDADADADADFDVDVDVMMDLVLGKIGHGHGRRARYSLPDIRFASY